jgi:hypothetical protein
VRQASQGQVGREAARPVEVKQGMAVEVRPGESSRAVAWCGLSRQAWHVSEGLVRRCKSGPGTAVKAR